MTVFKIGDRVEVIGISNGQEGVARGEILTIKKIDGDDRPIDDKYNYYWSDSDLKLIKGENKMVKNLKEYFVKHQDVIITVGIIVLLDHFVFGGALRSKIQGTIEGMLKGAEKKLNGTS